MANASGRGSSQRGATSHLLQVPGDAVRRRQLVTAARPEGGGDPAANNTLSCDPEQQARAFGSRLFECAAFRFGQKFGQLVWHLWSAPALRPGNKLKGLRTRPFPGEATDVLTPFFPQRGGDTSRSPIELAVRLHIAAKILRAQIRTANGRSGTMVVGTPPRDNRRAGPAAEEWLEGLGLQLDRAQGEIRQSTANVTFDWRQSVPASAKRRALEQRPPPGSSNFDAQRCHGKPVSSVIPSCPLDAHRPGGNGSRDDPPFPTQLQPGEESLPVARPPRWAKALPWPLRPAESPVQPFTMVPLARGTAARLAGGTVVYLGHALVSTPGFLPLKPCLDLDLITIISWTLECFQAILVVVVSRCITAVRQISALDGRPAG